MTENWVNQVLRSLVSMSNEDFRTVWHRKNWYNSKISLWILTIFCLWFFGILWIEGIETVCTKTCIYEVDKIYMF